jgi:glycosyltransferase involved in cell wall biosynthesis
VLRNMNITKAPLITVIVDTFNHEKYIEKALKSVFEQEYPRDNFEVIVVDDGSSDSTPILLRKYEGQVQIVEKQNGGQASAFNAAIPLARGEIVAFLDGDDWWAKDKLHSITTAFAADPLMGVVGHGFYEFDENERHVKAVVPEFGSCVTIQDKSDGIEFSQKMCFFGTSRVAIRKRVLNMVGQIPEALVVEADEYLSTVAIAKSRGIMLQQPLTFYRLHADNLYYFRNGDETKMRRKMSVLMTLGKALAEALFPVCPNCEIVEALVAPINLEAHRLKLQLENGWPWETFRVERASRRLAYSHTTWKYQVFSLMSLALTLLLSSKMYYRLQKFYSTMNLKRLRRFTGEPVPMAKIKHYSEDKNDGQS